MKIGDSCPTCQENLVDLIEYSVVKKDKRGEELIYGCKKSSCKDVVIRRKNNRTEIVGYRRPIV